jgi:hypothetical protein
MEMAIRARKAETPKQPGYYAEAVRRGGTLVFLPLATEQVDEAMAIMAATGGGHRAAAC